MGRKFVSILFVALFVYIASPLILPIAVGAVLTVLFFPWLERLERMKISTKLASALLTLLIFLGVLLPVGVLIFLGAKAGAQQLHALKEKAVTDGGEGFFEKLVNLPGVHSVIEKISNWFPLEAQELLNTATDLARTIGIKLADAFGGLIAHLPMAVVSMVVAIVSVYFLLVDGRALIAFIRRNSVFSVEQTDKLLHTLAETCRSVILATVVSGLAQALIESLACILTHTPNAALIGFLVFLASFVPLVGSAPITLGVALQQFIAGRTTVGFILLGAAGVVSIVDNLIRPIVLKGAVNLHPLLAFVGAFGGLQTIGIPGVLLGPIIAGLFVVTIQILIQGDTRS